MSQTITKVFGIIFLVVGILGFFNDPVIGLFEVDTLHNVIHLLTGILALGFSTTTKNAKSFLKVFGIIYGVVAILGLVIPGDVLLGLMEVNKADDVLHFLVAVIFLWGGFAKK